MRIDFLRVLLLILIILIVRWFTLSDEQKRAFIVSVRRIKAFSKKNDEKELKNDEKTSVPAYVKRKDKLKTSSRSNADKSFSMECANCGAALDLDLDNLLVYCPYCGNKLLIDVEQLGHLLTEREKTKREEERTRQERERTERFRHQREVELEKVKIETEGKIKLEKLKLDAERRHKIWNDLLIVFGIIFLLVLSFVIPKIIFQK